MRHLYSLLLLSSLFFLASPTARSQGVEFQWERTDRTADGWINGIGSDFSVAHAPDGTTLAATSEGVFRIVEQTEGGVTSHVAELVAPDVGGSFIGTIGERVYLWRKGAYGFAASTDNGLTWGEENEVWASSDNGLSWEPIIAVPGIDHIAVVDDGTPTGSGIVAYVRSIDSLSVFDPTGRHTATRDLPFPSGIIASPSGTLYLWRSNSETTQIFRSSDLGATWVFTARAGLEDILLYSLIYAGDSVLIASTAEGLAASYDEGESWTIQDRSKGSGVQAAGDDLMVTLESGYSAEGYGTLTLTTSSDAGATWTECDEVPTGFIHLLEDGSLYGVDRGVLLRTDGCGAPWKRVQGDFRSVRARSVFSIGNDFFALFDDVALEKNTTEGSVQLMRSRDDGATWEPVMENPTSILGITNEGKIYLSIERINHSFVTGDLVIEWKREVLRSDDRGGTWQTIPDLGAVSQSGMPIGSLQLQGEEYVMMSRKAPGQSSSIYPISDLLYSSDGGTTFEVIEASVLKESGAASYRQAILLPDGRIYGGPVSYDNMSTNFTRYDPRTGIREELPAPAPFNHIQISSSGRLYGWSAEKTFRRLDSAGRLFRSDDGGESWTELVNPVPEQAVESVSEGTNGVLYLTLDYLNSSETYQSSDDGMTWSRTRDLNWDIGFGPASEMPRLDIDAESIRTPDDLNLARTYYTAVDTVSDGYLRRTPGTMLVYSTDSGNRSWHAAVDDNLRDRRITGFAVNDRGVIVVGTLEGGIYRSVALSGVEEKGSRSPIVIDLW